jgi:hypothetical protein
MHHNTPQMAQPGIQPMGHQCRYNLSVNASNNEGGNLQPDNKHATPYAYVTTY